MWADAGGCSAHVDDAGVEQQSCVGARLSAVHNVAVGVVEQGFALPVELPFEHGVVQKGVAAGPAIVSMRLAALAKGVAVGILSNHAQALAHFALAAWRNASPQRSGRCAIGQIHVPKRLAGRLRIGLAAVAPARA